jgi:hypothetical protein
MQILLPILSILAFPLAVFGLFTWKWWERQWKGNIFQKGVFLTLFPLYGALYIVLNVTHK